MLHGEAGGGDADPADEAHEDGLGTAPHQLHEVGVQANGGHGHDDEELAQGLQRREGGRVGSSGNSNRGDDRGCQEEQDEGGEGALQ